MKCNKELISWHCCYLCGVKIFGKPKSKNMRGITVMLGKCEHCGRENQTLIPYDDFVGNGD